MRNESNLNKIASWILAFICSLVLVMALALSVIKFTLFSPSYMQHIADKVNYSQVMASEINETIMDLGRGSSVPPKVLKKTVTVKMVKQDFKNYVDAIYNGPSFKVANQTLVANEVVKKVKNYAAQINQTLDNEMLTNIDALGKEAGKRYAEIVTIPYLLVYAQKVMAFDSQLKLFLVGLFGIFILLLLGGISLASRLQHRKLRYVSTVFNGSGLMLLVFPGYLYFSKVFYRLGIGSKPLYDFLTTYVNDFILRFLWLGVLCLLIGIILFVLSEQKRKKLIHG